MELSSFQKIVYYAIKELLSEKPDGELTYTRILTSYLKGEPNKSIPWSLIQKSKIYGKCPKTNILSVKVACDVLYQLGLVNIVNNNGNHKYFLTDERPQVDENHKLFSEKISKYKKYLLEQFKNYIEAVCPFIKGLEHEKYFGFVTTKKRSTKEYNWFWLTDESIIPNSLKLSVRQTPASKAVVSTMVLSHTSFYDSIDSLLEIMKDIKERYELQFKQGIPKPVIFGPTKDVKKESVSDDEKCDFDSAFNFDYQTMAIHINDMGEEAINASLAVSESSPYKYSGDTRFVPKSLQKTVQNQTNFGFSFVKWKIVVWSTDKENPSFVKCALLVSKKTKSTWVLLSIPKRKVILVTNKPFSINTGESTISSDNLASTVFGQKQ